MVWGELYALSKLPPCISIQCAGFGFSCLSRMYALVPEINATQLWKNKLLYILIILVNFVIIRLSFPTKFIEKGKGKNTKYYFTCARKLLLPQKPAYQTDRILIWFIKFVQFSSFKLLHMFENNFSKCYYDRVMKDLSNSFKLIISLLQSY